MFCSNAGWFRDLVRFSAFLTCYQGFLTQLPAAPVTAPGWPPTVHYQPTAHVREPGPSATGSPVRSLSDSGRPAATPLHLARPAAVNRPLLAMDDAPPRPNPETSSIVPSVPHVVSATPDQCIIALDPSAANALYFNGAMVINAPNCGMVVDSSSSTAFKFSGSGTVTAKYIDVVGGYSNSGGLLSPTPQTNATAVANPLTFLTPPTTSACTFTNFSVSTGNSTLNPGTYCNGITISGATNITFNPGVYILMGGGLKISGASILNGTGVTFFLTQGMGYTYGPLEVTGSTVMNLSAPTANPYYGILFYQDPSIGSGKTASAITGSSASTLNGVLYFPTTGLTYSGASSDGKYLILVADTITITGSAVLNDSFPACRRSARR